MKTRIIPTILTDGISQVKGEQFDNWRTVGVIRSAIEVHANRDVDELLLLDVWATKEERVIDAELVGDMSTVLRVPFTVGGGIDSISKMATVLEAGADKVVIGSAAVINPNLVESLANEFGSQAVVCAIDSASDKMVNTCSHSGSVFHEISPTVLATRLESSGCGELLIQNVSRDGKMEGMDYALLSAIAGSVRIPVIGSSGAGSPTDVLQAVKSGCSAVSVGALFQFTEVTPRMIKDFLGESSVDVRN